MKKRVTIISIFIFILITLFFIFNKNEYTNNEIFENYNDVIIDVIYPKVNNEIADKYIINYINSEIESFKYDINKYKNLYIDYDINISNKIFDITFYVYKENSNLVSSDIERININSNNNEIKTYKELNKNYDLFHNEVIDKNSKLVAFTFDDGPSYKTSKIVDILNSYNATATFFVVGNKVKNYPKILNRMIDLGMEIGNHTYSHKELTRLKESQINDEISKTNDEIFKVTKTNSILFRPSYGTINKKIKNNLKYPLILWNLDTLDWRYHNSEYIKNKIINNVNDGDIILMHDTYSATVKAIEKVLPVLYEMNYRVVSVSELFYYKNIVPKLGYGYGSIK